MKNKYKSLTRIAFIMVVLSCFAIFSSLSANIVYAKVSANTDTALDSGSGGGNSTTTCTHTVYSTNEKDTYHYSYCDICGKANGRTKHSFKYAKYNIEKHKATCSCGYTKYVAHTSSAAQISINETISGKTYSSTADLDKYHKTVCTVCGEVTGVAEHNWTGGNTTAHTCSSCNYVHSKRNDATKGLHYFDLNKIIYLGNIASCKVCGEMLTLEYTSDSILPTLPKKEEYTMVGNPNPMQEVELSTDQKITANFMPINENGEIIPLDDSYLKVRSYTHGNYYKHYSKLMGGDLKDISSRINYLENSETMDYITRKLSELGALGGYNEEKKQEIIDDLNSQIRNDPELGWLDVYALTSVVSEFGDFAVEAIRTPLLEWFARDLLIKSTWLAGNTTTLRNEFFGDMTSASNREYVIYFSELPAGNYEILMSRLLTHGINFNLFSYSIGGITQLLYSTLFTVGGGAGDPPSNIKGYISVAYRDIKGNVILDKTGQIMTPKDAIYSSVVYSGSSAKNVTKSFTAEMDWTQVAGYRFKGVLVKYGTGSGGNYGIYNKPSEMTVTTNPNVSVTSSFTYSGLGISVVFYYEPVKIISLQHKVSNDLINTDKNLSNILLSDSTLYDISNINYAPKKFESLNKNFWPGYILTGYTVYSDSVSSSNIIAKKTFDVNTTTKMNSKNDAKRAVEIITAITSGSDINGATVVNKEKLGYGKDKIIVFEYLYPQVEIVNMNYKTGAIIKDINNSLLTYTIKLIGDNMLIKSLDTTAPGISGYHEMNVNLVNGTTKNFKYDASNLSLVQVWIYTKDLNKGTKTLYKVIAGNNSFVPSNVAKDKIQMASDFSSFTNYYILNTEELITVMSKVWSDLYIEFKYYEGANKVDVKYVDEEGNTLMPDEVYKILDEGNGGKTATVPRTDLDGYVLDRFVLDGETDSNVSTLENVNIKDNGKDRELIFIYKKGKKDDIPDVFEDPFAIIRSNDRGNEEYNVDDAMPTDEDLYANVVTDSYIIENVISILDRKQKVNVILKKKYYTSNNDNGTSITSNIDVATATIPLEYDLIYQYYGGANSNLFILNTAIIDNEAVFDKKHYDTNGKVLIEANYGNKVPYMSYIEGGKLFIITSEECTLIKDGDVYYLEVMLSGVDYEKPDMNAIVKSYENNHTAIDEIIRKNSVVNGDFLSVTAENQEIIYLNGLDVLMSAERLATIVELADANYYYRDSKAPLTNGNVLFNEREVYTYSKMANKTYPSTKLTVNYKLHQNIVESKVTDTKAEVERVKVYLPNQIRMNSISIHTPIVNYTELIPKTNDGENDNQLIDESIKNVLTLDSIFSIFIPHNGMHNYAVNSSGVAYDGYGDKAYNYGGSRAKDEQNFAEKGLKMQGFASKKLVKFSFDVYAIKFAPDGETIVYQKLILANTWFNLGEIDKNTGLNIEKYNFIIPVWVQDKAYGDISVRIVASNIPDDFDTTVEDASFIARETSNALDKYVLEENFRVYIAGVLYDLEIRDSDDIGWMNKLEAALKLGNSSANKNMYLPLGQSNQNAFIGYRYGIKLGYRFYFDLKTKGKANDEIVIKPNFYYVSKDGGIATSDISLFYSTTTAKYKKLDEVNDLNIAMSMSTTHGTINNSGFTFELVKGKVNNPDKVYTNPTNIGKIINGLDLKPVDTKLPRNNILEAANLYGYKGNTTKFVEEAIKSSSVENDDTIRNSTGHWYGEFFLPASTKVALGKNVTSSDVLRNESLLKSDGYIIVTFDTIITKSNAESYLSYSKPTEKTRWEKEGTSYEPYTINLPNGTIATIPGLKEGAAMVIYETSLRANDDFESEGTH